MPNLDDLLWFKSTFTDEVNSSIANTPFSLDFIAALASQETGDVWPLLRKTLTRSEILALCVGDTLDADKGRSAFPKTKADLIAVSQGDMMFTIAHQALVDLGKYVPTFTAVAKKPDKFCHGYGIFQVDLQFLKTDPEFFLEKQWTDFGVCLDRCLKELHAAMSRVGFAGRSTLSDLEQVYVAIAYNAGRFKPEKGLKQGYFDGKQFYGEKVFDLLRLAQTAASSSSPALIRAPQPGSAAIVPPTAIGSTGTTMQVDAFTMPVSVHREPKIAKANPTANIVATLPAGHLVKTTGSKGRFAAIETSLQGAVVRGFVPQKALVAMDDNPPVPIAAPQIEAPTSGIVAVYAPRRAGTVTKRTQLADAHSLNEAGQPGRSGATPQELRKDLATIIDYLGVDNPANIRYQPRSGATFCNIYAHDYCSLAGAYLPRVWWTPDAIERLAQGQTVQPLLGATIDEQRANDLFRWLRAFGLRFGWRQTGRLTSLQTAVNSGGIGLIVARRKEDGRSGHIVAVVPETDDKRAKRDPSGAVIAPLQSQASARNFRYGAGTANWWSGEQFAENAFWIHA
jgi:hypothetical protein